jgi:5'-nucleotidase
MKRNILFTIVLVLCCSLGTLSAQQTQKLVLLQTSDTHSQIEVISQKGDRDFGTGGVVRRAALIDSIRKANPMVLLFDCGDICQGTPYYNLYKGDVEIEMMNEMHYDAATIGNHEFDFGIDNLARLYRCATFPIVCANYDCHATVLKNVVKPYTVFVRKGIRIGVFGLSPVLDGLVQKKNYGALVYMDPTAAANKTAKLLREKEHCDVVVCLSHLGIYEDKKMVPLTQGIDVVLGGHSHTFMKAPFYASDKDGKKVMIIHTGARGVNVGQIELTLKKE